MDEGNSGSRRARWNPAKSLTIDLDFTTIGGCTPAKIFMRVLLRLRSLRLLPKPRLLEREANSRRARTPGKDIRDLPDLQKGCLGGVFLIVGERGFKVKTASVE